MPTHVLRVPAEIATAYLADVPDRARTCTLGVVDATIYHNPRCTKSRQALARLEEAGADITVVKYLDDVLTKAQLTALIKDAGLTVREAVRTGEAEYKELGLAEASDEALLDAMIAHPRLIQRPFVVTANGTRLARPTEAIDEIL